MCPSTNGWRGMKFEHWKHSTLYENGADWQFHNEAFRSLRQVHNWGEELVCWFAGHGSTPSITHFHGKGKAS